MTRWARAKGNQHEYLLALAAVGGATALGVVLRDAFDDADHALLQLMAVVLVASRVGRGPAFTAAITAVAAFNFFFVPPYYTFRVADLRFFITFAMMGATSLTVSALTLRVREAAEASRRREQRTAALYDISRAFAVETETRDIADSAAEHSARLVGGEAVIWLVRDQELGAATAGALGEDPREATVARWVFDHGQPAGRGTDTLPAVRGRYLPIAGAGGTLGVLGVRADGELDPEQQQLLDLFAAITAHALERAQLVERAAAAAVQAEAERTRASLLSAVSHDLRTPLASIVGAAELVLSHGRVADDDRAILENLRGEAGRLGRLVQGLLQLTRLESGAVAPRREWWPLSDVLNDVLGRLHMTYPGTHVLVRAAEGMELYGDGLLLGQLLENLLDNAIKYAPDGPVEVRAEATGTLTRLEVLDRGRGVPAGQERKIFERFYRAADGGRAEGAGLGLAICAAIVKIHGGDLWAENRADGPGARFVVTLPRPGSPPAPPEEDP